MRKLMLISTALVLVVLLSMYSVRTFSQPKMQLEGASCDEWARSYGRQLQERSLTILDAVKWPEDRIDPAYDLAAQKLYDDLTEARLQPGRALHAMYQRNPAAFANCSPERFLEIAEQELGPRFRQEVPPRFVTAGPGPDWAWYRQVLHKEIVGALQPE